jgi:hypothetical protein
MRGKRRRKIRRAHERICNCRTFESYHEETENISAGVISSFSFSSFWGRVHVYDFSYESAYDLVQLSPRKAKMTFPGIGRQK